MANWRDAIKFLGGSQEKEEELIQEMAQQIRQVVENYRDENQGVRRRPQHAKMIAGVRDAVFVVSPDIPEDLSLDFLKPRESYRAAVRFSNAAGFIRADDAEPDLRGAAIKIRLPEGMEQDFLMTNAKEHHAKDALEAMATSLSFSQAGVLQQIADFVEGPDEGFLHTNEGIKQADNKITGLAKLAGRVGPITAARILRTLKKQMGTPVESLATETYWSRAPIRIGEVAVKYRLLPATPKGEVEQSESDLRGEFQRCLERGEVRFQFQVQRYIDEERTPIEDARKAWESPHETIAELVIPQQRLAEDEDFFERLDFNPWHVNTANFEPIGNMNRARKVVYPAAVEARKQGPA